MKMAYEDLAEGCMAYHAGASEMTADDLNVLVRLYKKYIGPFNVKDVGWIGKISRLIGANAICYIAEEHAKAKAKQT